MLSFLKRPSFKTGKGAVLALLLAVLCSTAAAQPLINAKNVALGGGGAAYLTGPESNFYNPANLMIYDHQGRLHFTLADIGLFYQPVLSSAEPGTQFDQFHTVFAAYKPGEENISHAQAQAIIASNYPRRRLLAQNRSRADIIWGAIQWQGSQKSFSVAVRSRIATRIVAGRGWYSSDHIKTQKESVRDFTLIKQQQALHEISFGYAREFQFINGLIPKVGKLYAGIAPKIIIPGAYINAEYTAQNHFPEDGSPSFYTQQFAYRSSGSYSQMIADYRSSGDLHTAISPNVNATTYSGATGFGLGFDFGLTYVLGLGKDVSIIENNNEPHPAGKSLRLSFSLTDLGLISYRKSPLRLHIAPDTLASQSQPPAVSKFVGSKGQYPAFFEEAGQLPNPVLAADSTNNASFSTLLPTSINMGTMLDLQKLKFMGDLTIGLNNTAFTDTKLAMRLGVEVWPISSVPLRLGTRLAAGRPALIGLGTGFESKHWELMLSTQLLMRSNTFTTEIIGGALTGLRFHF